jgi:phosphatidylglycerol---prolipoprotein diacylglyceryl transferase
MFPAFNPIALQLGPVAVHWYGLAYVVAMVLGLWLAKRLGTRHPAPGIDAQVLDDLFMGVVLGVIIGGRVGYILFYNLEAYLAHPALILAVWQGGMAFHGGALGVIIALLLFAKKRGVHPADLADRVVPVLPIGLFLGRLANFINGELVGRPVETASLPWAMIFPHIDALARHPSQLYQAGLEGLVLGFILWLTVRKRIVRWLPSGVFLVGYGLARVVGEVFRTPEIVHHVAGLDITQGQLLSVPMILGGCVCLYLASRQPAARA